jgi:hypothetical protein
LAQRIVDVIRNNRMERDWVGGADEIPDVAIGLPSEIVDDLIERINELMILGKPLAEAVYTAAREFGSDAHLMIPPGGTAA